MTDRVQQPGTLSTLGAPDRNVLVYLWHTFCSFRYVPLVALKIQRDFHQTTILGWWWLIIRALVPTLGLIVIFEVIGVFEGEDVPYPLFVVAGMTVFTGIDIGLMKGVRAMASVLRVVQAVPFPRLVVPLGALCLPMIYQAVFLAAFVLVLVAFFLETGSSHLVLSWNLLVFPVCMAVVLLLIASISGIGSVLFLIARDVRFVMPLVRQLWFFATPVIYPITVLPPDWAHVLMLANPMAPLVETARWSLFGVGVFQPLYFFTAVGGTLLAFLISAWFIMRAEWFLDDL